MKKLLPVFLAVILLFSGCSANPDITVKTEEFNTNYKFVFVHGLSGWGSYDTRNKFLKYWGMLGGDLMKYLNKQGFDCYAASVDPYGSAWDRACELYAQLTGSVVDYGKAHSERCKHERYGKDFSSEPLIEDWSSENKINLLGHSFGGATVRLLAELMANGSAEEAEATDEAELSPLFTGGKGDWIHSITALAAPHNGTTAYNANDGSVNVDDELTFMQRKMSDMVSSATAGEGDGRVETDYANYDLKIDNALALNESLSTLENVYYFSFPCSSTTANEDGTYSPDTEITETMFVKSAMLMGRVTGKTEGGFVFDEGWLDNDGLVNTVSARAPSNAPQKEYAEGENESGIWYIMPTYRGDHMSLQGGMMKKNNVKAFYVEHLTRINML